MNALINMRTYLLACSLVVILQPLGGLAHNPDSHQWSIYLVDVDKGTLDLPPVVGQFTGTRGEFYDQEQYKGRAILVRYMWLNISPKSARMEQSFSPDGGKTWETNWICELTR